MTVFIDKFWIEAVLTEAYPSFIKEGGIDLDGNGAIEGKEVFEDFNKDGVIGDRDDYKEYLRQNRSELSQKISFFKWGEKLSVDNRIHQEIYLLSDIHLDTQIASTYAFIAGLAGVVDKAIGQRKLSPQVEAQFYYTVMEQGAGILFAELSDPSLVDSINNRLLDCDSSSSVAIAIGDERGLNLQPVLAPGHSFLRGKNDNDSEFNIDLGRITSNEEYKREYAIDPDLVRKGLYLKTLDDNKLEALSLNNRGVVLLNLGRFEEALASFDRAVDIYPNFEVAHCNRGIVLEKLGQNKEALASYDRTIAIYPNFGLAHRNRGTVLLNLGRNEEALVSLDRSIAIDPNDGKAHNGRGKVLAKLGRYEEAFYAYEEGIAIAPWDAKVYNDFGIVLEKLGRYQDALRAFEWAGQLDATLSPSSIKRLRLRFLGYWE